MPASSYPVSGAIGARYASIKSLVGDPTGPMTHVDGGYQQLFRNGVITYKGGLGRGAYALYGAAYTKWASLPASVTYGWLGWPASVGDTDVYFNNGKTVSGALIANPDRGTENAIGGSIYRTWIGAGRTAALGYPTSDEVDGRGGGVRRMNWFTHGAITADSTGTHAVTGSIYNVWMRAGSETSSYGAPLSNAVKTGGVTQQRFAGRSSVLSYQNGTVIPVSGAIGAKYIGMGMNRSALGYPTGAMYRVTGGYQQKFLHGAIAYTNGRISVGDNRPAAPGTSIKPSTSQQVMVATPTRGHLGNWARYQWTGSTWQRIDLRPTSSVFGQGGVVPAYRRVQNTRTTPSGTFGFVSAFGVGNPGTKLSYRKVDSCSWWDENPKDSSYNRFVENCHTGLRDPATGEHLANYTGSMYRQAAVLDYNYADPRIRSGRRSGAGIFLHYATSYTGGCVALNNRTELNRTIAWLDPAKNPKIVIK